MERLSTQLSAYGKEGVYPFHMPGHKRNTEFTEMGNPYQIDITEVEGFDDLHHPEGILKEAMAMATTMYGSTHTYFLINGSTCGILSAISACAKRGEKILVARNCHKSVYHAVFLNALTPVYLYPPSIAEYGIDGGIDPEQVASCLRKDPEIRCIVITSPTYEGIVSDVRAIAAIAHQYQIPLIVDEAHGAHFGFHASFPVSAVSSGADIIIQSVHKTLPSFTQTALLHFNSGYVDQERVETFLRIYQSSSPSYILMAGIDQCMHFLREKGPEAFPIYDRYLKEFNLQMSGLKRLRMLTPKEEWGQQYYVRYMDPSKIVISVKDTDMTGKELKEILLTQYQLELEMASKDYVIAMTSVCDKKEGFERLARALLEIDRNCQDKPARPLAPTVKNIPLVMDRIPYEAYGSEAETVVWAESVGRIAKEMFYIYPPGVPFIVPGEIISKECLQACQEYQKAGFTIRGQRDASGSDIQVIKQVDLP